ncbi:uncharacterized protein LOC127728917 [Mytilus californianus]|uniref:uncharacterized protein LOC127728917 n=1 Tax=Mytilus californianus TaxID=6549 RepID=UPI002245B0F1|nr:uncharacterized protein LOC127728917 [Mytilus californianus]
MLLVVLSSVLVSVYGLCQNVDGQSVSWWILFQQKERPYFHNYIDSTNSQRIKDHYPERNDSVLSRSVASVIHNNEAEYIIYSSDLINVKDIAAKFSIPTYSKWMHGILGTVSSWESGFWIIHNNLLFPALTNGALVVPGSKAWYATTVGDSTADVFYICLTADNKGNMTEMLKSIMAGNPFLYKKRLQNYDFLQPYLKEVRSLKTSFGYEMSAEIFLNCMHTSSNNVSTNCLFTYAVTTGVGITIFTRPRGMIKHSSAFCYDDQSISSLDFLKLEKRSPLQSGFFHSMFALSDKTDSSVTGMTCFGQDIAANAETIAVMICAYLPTVYVDVIKSTRLTQWSCNNKDTKDSQTDIAKIYNKGQTRHRTDTLTLPDIKSQISSASPTEKDANEHKREHIHDATNDSDEKDVAKFCQMYDCDNYNSNVESEDFNINSFNSQLLKNQKLTNRYL